MRRDVQNGELAPRATSASGLREALAFGCAAAVGVWTFLAEPSLAARRDARNLRPLAVLTLGQPKHLLRSRKSPICRRKNLTTSKIWRIASSSGGSWFRRGTSADARGEKATNQVPGLTLGVPPANDEPPESTRLTRRLDAVRSRQGKGAVLTGRIDARQHDWPVSIRTHRCGRRLRCCAAKTADSSSNSLAPRPSRSSAKKSRGQRCTSDIGIWPATRLRIIFRRRFSFTARRTNPRC